MVTMVAEQNLFFQQHMLHHVHADTIHRQSRIQLFLNWCSESHARHRLVNRCLQALRRHSCDCMMMNECHVRNERQYVRDSVFSVSLPQGRPTSHRCLHLEVVQQCHRLQDHRLSQRACLEPSIRGCFESVQHSMPSTMVLVASHANAQQWCFLSLVRQGLHQHLRVVSYHHPNR